MPDYSNLVKVQAGVVTFEPVPDFLTNSSIPVDMLADLSWLGIPDYAGWGWWPLVRDWPALTRYQSYDGDEVLTVDEPNRVVNSTRAVRDWTTAEILAYKQASVRHISKLAFRNRFTQAEKIAFEMAQVDNPTAPQDARLAAAGVRVMEKDLAVSQFVDLNDATLQAALAQLEQNGVLSAGRASGIIWGDIQPSELP